MNNEIEELNLENLEIDSAELFSLSEENPDILLSVVN